MSRIKCSSLVLTVAVAFLSLAEVGLAHKVGVFAFVDGDEIQVECRFSRSQHVKNGRLAFIDRETGDTIGEGTTDARGIFRFRPSDAFLATGHGLTIRLFAGEGHQDDWSMGPEELRALSQTAPPAPVETTPALAGVDLSQLETVIGRVVDAKLAPVKQALLRQQEGAGAPGLRDVIGGIGWILGLLGLATYLKYRR